MQRKKFWMSVVFGVQLAFLPVHFTHAQEQTPATEESGAPAIVDQAEQKEMQHWLTEDTGVRHNKNCRFYEKSKGRPCAPDEGTACKVCGG